MLLRSGSGMTGFKVSMNTSRLLFVASVLAMLAISGCTSSAESHELNDHEEHGKAHHSPEHPDHKPEPPGHEPKHKPEHESHHPQHKIVVTSPIKMEAITTQAYVCQIHSCQHIEVRALETGYLEQIFVKEGQAVKKGDMLFKILPTLHQAKLAMDIAEANRIQIELDNAVKLNQKSIVSPQELAIKQAELAKAQAKVGLATAELNFCELKAPFDGIVDRQRHQLGSLIEDDDVLTTLSDNSVMWAYFNVPEARYLEYKTDENAEIKIELKLANGKLFPQPGKIGAIEADFSNRTGNIAFRADFDNPQGLLRNGQTGTILIHTALKDSIVIPQRATFEILARQYVYVVDKDNVVHQRDITIQHEQDDIFVIKEGLTEDDKIIFEGIRQVREGDRIEFEFLDPQKIMGNLKNHAE